MADSATFATIRRDIRDNVGFDGGGAHRRLFAPDGQKEGMAAFIAKRKPIFRHR